MTNAARVRVARKRGTLGIGLDHPAKFAADELATPLALKPSDVVSHSDIMSGAQVRAAFASHKPRDQGEGRAGGPRNGNPTLRREGTIVTN